MDCQRCAEIRASDPADLIFWFDPSKPRDMEAERRSGERVRASALAMHASAGHPTEADYGMPPPPRRPTAVGVLEPFGDLFAFIDRMRLPDVQNLIGRLRKH